MYASPFTSQQQQQQKPTMNGNSTTTGADKMSYKDRFQNNFNKFASSPESPKLQKSSTSDTGATTTTADTNYITAHNNNNNNESNGNSHLFYLFDKAQGVTPGSTISDGSKTISNGHHKSDSSSCSKYLTDPQSALRNQPQPASPREGIQRGSASTGSEEGGSISERAVPATPDFLRGNPLSSLSINNEAQNVPRQPMRSPYKTPDRDLEQNQILRSRPASATSSPAKTRSSLDDGRRKPESTSDEYYPCRPSFEQTRRHWVYTPKMFNAQEDSKPVERQRHPGARSRPLPEYLNFRKYSVPLVSPRPKVEVQQKAVDDQSPQKEMRSLQKTSSEIDSSSVHQLLREGDELSHYDEHSIRYTGRTNPSKVFQLLQSATGSQDDLLVAKPPVRRRSRKPEVDEAKQDADDIVDISYVGGNIPSRTFQCLKEAFDDKDYKDPFSSNECLDVPVESTRSIKVIHLRPRKSIDDGITAL